jgi:cyclophilin family peptidyl-prolyl cis-trans isomerase/HEAT repeat protein
MKYFWLVLVVLVVVLGGCGGEGVKNVYEDETLQRIYTWQDERRVEPLVEYFDHERAVYRRAAALACASIQEGRTVEPLSRLLSDADDGVRQAAAYALGQVGEGTAEPVLMKAFAGEKSAAVRRYILEAVGKCGTLTGLDFLSGLTFRGDQKGDSEGQAMGLYRLALRRLVSPAGTAKAVELLNQRFSSRCRLFAAHYLARAEDIDLSPYRRRLPDLLAGEADVPVAMALVLGLAKLRTPAVREQLKSLLAADVDYRLKINGVRALSVFDYEEVKEPFLAVLAGWGGNVNTAIQVSEFFLNQGRAGDAGRYFDTARKVANWRCRANLLGAALKYAGDKEAVADYITAAYRQSTHVYEQANLLRALAGDSSRYRFVEEEVFADRPLVVKSLGLAALVEMAGAAPEQRPVFAKIFERAVGSGDVALVGQAAAALREPAMNFKALYPPEDIGFLKAALAGCRLPVDIEAYLELQRTIDFFSGSSTPSPAPDMMNNPIDWHLVCSTPADQEVIIKTAKGDITIRLLVNESPGSAANFIRLIRQGFYRGSRVHRVVPNFVIQDGCPRGDGWGGPDFSIRSELGPLYYEAGSLGMASAGKDTESSQWFITHSATPHLDGRYTIFARVVSGLDVVHRLEVGDEILGLRQISGF